MILSNLLIFTLISLTAVKTVFANSVCRTEVRKYKIGLQDHIETIHPIDLIKHFKDIHPIRLWLLAEQLTTLEQWKQTHHKVQVQMQMGKSDRFNINSVEITNSNTLFRDLANWTQLPWLIHPYNTSSQVPQISSNSQNVQVYLTASRSTYFLTGPFQGTTVRLATDRPQPNGGLTNKLDVEAELALRRSNQIQEIQKKRKVAHDNLQILTELGSITHKTSGIGMLVRNIQSLIKSLKKGNIILPAFAIDALGVEIAKLNGEDPISFWINNYETPIGTLKARLALEYQIQFSTPNKQNILIEFDSNFRPTGRFFFRDVSDTFYIDFLARAASIELDPRLDMNKHDSFKLKPEGGISRVQFLNQNSGLSFPEIRKVGDLQISAHNQAYIKHFNNELNIYINPEAPDAIQQLNSYLKSPEGQLKYKNYYHALSR